MALKINTHPVINPVSLDEAKDHIRVTHSSEDSLILRLVTAATRWAEDYTGYKFCTQTWDYYMDTFPYRTAYSFNYAGSGDDFEIIPLPYPPLQSVTHVKYYNGSNVLTTLVEDTDYRVDTYHEPGRVEPIESWPDTYDRLMAVQIRFVCGYTDLDDIDDDIKTAILMRFADLYENRQESYVVMGGLSVSQNTITATSLLNKIKLFDRTW